MLACRRPTSARRTSSERTAAVIGGAGNSLAPEFTCDPRLGGIGGWGEDARHRLHQGAGLRQESAAHSAVRPAHAVAHEPRPDALQELRDSRRSEAAVPRGVLQHLQHGVRHDRVRQRHRPGARDDVQPSRRPRAERHRRLRGRRVRSDRRATRSRRTRWRTSGRSTSSAGTGSWSWW